MASKSSIFTSTKGAGRLVPALFTSMSNGVRRRDRPAYGVEIGHIELKRGGLVAARADGLRRGLDLRSRARSERHVRAGLRQRGRRRQARCRVPRR